MENKEVTKAEPQNTAPIETTTAETKKKTSPWLWIIGGCLFVVVITIISVVALGFFGFKAAKNEYNKHAPELKNIHEQMEKTGEEMKNWEEKSKKIRETLPEGMPQLEAE